MRPAVVGLTAALILACASDMGRLGLGWLVVGALGCGVLLIWALVMAYWIDERLRAAHKRDRAETLRRYRERALQQKEDGKYGT